MFCQINIHPKSEITLPNGEGTMLELQVVFIMFLFIDWHQIQAITINLPIYKIFRQVIPNLETDKS